jgi:predicted Zn-dependent protease
MKYENREIPEGINVSEQHPLKDFLVLVGGISALLIAVVMSLSLAAGYLARFIPFQLEMTLAEKISEKISGTDSTTDPATVQQQKQIHNYLQTLANALAKAQNLPTDMRITVHYSTDETINAFATLGGNILMFQGLLEKMPSENALAMVMAHEIAHIKHRDPIVATGRGLTIALALGSIAGISDSNIQQWLGGVSVLTTLSFSREQETAADDVALQTLQRYYGHSQDADVLFSVLKTEHGDAEPPAFLNSHPGLDARIERIRAFQTQQEQKQQQGNATKTLTPLPEFVKTVAKK